MARIFGFSIKGMKYFQGRDWEGCQGSIYYKGKKVGFYNDLGDGAPASVDFYESGEDREYYEGLLQDAIEKYYGKFPLEEKYANLKPDAEMFMAKLVELIEDEREYRRFRKVVYEKTKSYSAVIALYLQHKPFGSYIRAFNTVENAEKLKSDSNISNVRIYRSPDDFIITEPMKNT